MARGKFDLSQIIQQSQKKKQEQQSIDFVLRTIPLERLRLNPKNFYRIENIESLADSIKMRGLMHNLLVTAADEDGIHTIIDGERRFRALSLLAKEKPEYRAVPCKISPYTSDTINELCLIDANAQTRVISPAEAVEQTARLTALFEKAKEEGIAVKGRVRENVAEYMGISPARVGDYMQISSRATEEVKDALKGEQITITEAHRLSRVEPEKQREAVQAIREGKDKKAAIPTPKKRSAAKAEKKKEEPCAAGEDGLRRAIRCLEELLAATELEPAAVEVIETAVGRLRELREER